MEFVIGVDIGTSGTKALALSPTGEVLHTSYEAYEGVSWHPDQQELIPSVLLAAVVRTLQETNRQCAKKGILQAVSFSCALHSLISINDKGIPLTHAITWSDQRSKVQAARLKGSPEGREIYRRTGTPIHPMSPLCKILWMQEQRPELFAQTFKFISIKEYIWFELFGCYEVDHSIASGTGLFDIYTCQWYKPSLALAGITEEKLSTPVSPKSQRTGLRAPYRSSLGIAPEVPFVIGANDGCLANLGSKAVNPGDLALTIGTSGAVRMMVSQPAYDSKERIFNYVVSDHLYVCGGAINNGGVALKWYIDNFLKEPGTPPKELPEQLAEISQVAAGSEGLIFLPYLMGERAPIWDANAKGVFFGIYSGHTSRHFLRAVVEGICFSLFQITQCLEELVGPVRQIYASGGFIHSDAWLQMLADVFEKPVCVSSSADASAIGAAILGWHSLGRIERLTDLEALVRVQQLFLPIEANQQAYQRNYSIFSVLYEKLKDEFSTLDRPH